MYEPPGAGYVARNKYKSKTFQGENIGLVYFIYFIFGRGGVNRVEMFSHLSPLEYFMCRDQ